MREIQPEQTLEAYRKLVPYPYTILTLVVPRINKDEQVELFGQITRITDHDWSQWVANFPRWERQQISNEYEAVKERIAIPAVNYIALDEYDMETHKASIKSLEADFLQMYMKPVTFRSEGTHLVIDVTE